MSTPFFSTKELGALRALAYSALTTEVVIRHRVVTQNEYGDDETSYSDGDTVMGWVFSTPTPVQVEDFGALVTANTYRLFVPVGTDISPGDLVDAEGETFVVSDTTYESTWNVMIRCSLRRRE